MNWILKTGVATLLALTPLSALAQAPLPTFGAPTDPAAAEPEGESQAGGDIAFGAYQRGFYITAFREAMKRVTANSKDAAAMTLIGEIYREGYAVKQDTGEASHWYRLASGLGDREAAFELGVLLLNGAPGVPKDRAAAKAQFELAAQKNEANALYNLGVMALDSEGGAKPDFAKAAEYFRRSAEAGDEDGSYSYGVMLREGRGVPLDIGESAHWLKRAADAGVIAGQVEYGIMLFNGVGVEKNEAGAAKIFLRAAARNNPIAQNRLAHLYLTGRGVPRDLVEAATWNRFAKTAGLDDPELDAATANLTPEENEKVNELVRRQAAF
ncbi:MAG TPA: tetratricopeptide repeat protein [Roseiarcus sp.]